MEFNTLVKTELLPLFKKYKFEVSEEFKNVMGFRSSILKVNLAFNEYDKSHLVEIGRLGETLYPLNDNVIKELWGYSALPIEQVTSNIFVHNLSIFFETKKGIELLKGNLSLLSTIVSQECEKYTPELIQRQILETLSKAWEAKDYFSFIDGIDKIDISNLPQSYMLKYKIAKKKLQQTINTKGTD